MGRARCETDRGIEMNWKDKCVTCAHYVYYGACHHPDIMAPSGLYGANARFVYETGTCDLNSMYSLDSDTEVESLKAEIAADDRNVNALMDQVHELSKEKESLKAQLAKAQEFTECPIGISTDSRESRSICSAGTCYGCAVDRLHETQAQLAEMKQKYTVTVAKWQIRAEDAEAQLTECRRVIGKYWRCR